MRYIKFKESYAERKEEYFHSKFVKGFIVLAFLSIVIFIGLYLSIKLKSFLTFLMVLFLAIILFRFWGPKLDYFLYRRDIAGKGIEGEDEFFNVLKSIGDDYIVIQNYEVPETRSGDIDFLIVGPKGIFIFEIKNYNGVFRICSTNEIFKKKWHKNILKPHYELLNLEYNPLTQLLNQKGIIEKILKDSNIHLPVYPNLVFINGEIESYPSNYPIFILDKSHYKRFPSNLFKMDEIRDYSLELETKILEALKIDKSKIQIITPQNITKFI
ncbi:MAG: hypothetical protein KatS3mg096_562 [Candidatus Parcubacteria bacterium]|nr:MAG: hypothetical protein KatS3mg095_0957 [Candidatus Parcubacteria bacterium]GIW67694.1 MAG: hypothetical protein KatS3mg096_562 [Candidatus Parcubacteria bacterium]